MIERSERKGEGINGPESEPRREPESQRTRKPKSKLESKPKIEDTDKLKMKSRVGTGVSPGVSLLVS